eukprot:COSAG01_NODE_66754_length_269_cov_0.605882_1_plen_48_part_10
MMMGRGGHHMHSPPRRVHRVLRSSQICALCAQQAPQLVQPLCKAGAVP